MRYLTRTLILEVPDLVTEEVSVPEWGGTVLVRGLTGAERDRLESSIIERKGRKGYELNTQNIRAKLVAGTVIDENGDLLFSYEDIGSLTQKSAVALQRVVEVAQRLSGMSEQDVEELVKNSVSGQSDDSTSD